MSTFNLVPFPGTSCPAVKSFTVVAQRSGTNLRLLYKVDGDIDAIKISATSAPVPTENLWHHTCFELFFMILGEDAYQEYNFSPSGAWDHYHFTDYRERAKEGTKIRPTMMKFSKTSTSMQMAVEVVLPTDEEVDAALAAVIEDNNGNRTYWALRHTADEPDFHDSGAFAAEL